MAGHSTRLANSTIAGRSIRRGATSPRSGAAPPHLDPARRHLISIGAHLNS
jgi:hypothetical protein